VAGQGLLARARSWIAKAAEGSVRPGPWHLPLSGGWLSAEAGQYWNWWQMGYQLESTGRSAIVEACVSAYAQTCAMCPGDHWRETDKGGRERVDTSAASRLLRNPNAYQSSSDFHLGLTRQLYEEGNAYALALRNDRFEADEFHLMVSKMCRPVTSVDGDIFYRLAGNDVIAQQLGGTATQEIVVPARDVLHVKLNPRRSFAPWPLVGESPLSAVYGDLATQRAIMESQGQFYNNQSRPSAVLSTDLQLSRDQVEELRQRWEDQSKGLNSGKTPILTAGLKVNPWNVSSRDAQMAEFLKISEEHIALAFRIPLQILGLGGHTSGSGGGTGSTTEVLMRMWIASGLGFALNHIEQAYDNFFRLRGQPHEYVELSTDSLLRSAYKDRIDALVKAVQGGVMSPNEARNAEDFDSVEFGDEPRVQQQVVPLSAAGQIPASPGPPSPPSPSGPPASGPPASGPPPKEFNPNEPSYKDALAVAQRCRIAAHRHIF
jgi:HK97 family phage portal protein